MVNNSNRGLITQIIGPVVDIEFPNGGLPKIFDAVVIYSLMNLDVEVICEVQQLLGDNTVRAVSMTSTDGLRHGYPVFKGG
jgi:F-type H+-transporting ATPase subunit beta